MYLWQRFDSYTSQIYGSHIDIYCNKCSHLQGLGEKEKACVKKITEKFHKKLIELRLASCSECNERWYAPLKHVSKPNVKHQCRRCKKELTIIAKQGGNSSVKMTKFIPVHVRLASEIELKLKNCWCHRS